MHSWTLRALLVTLVLAAIPLAPARAEDNLGAWREYALRGVTPSFDWAQSPSAASLEPTVLSVSGAVRTSAAPKLHFVDVDHGRGLGLAVSRSLASDTPAFENGGLAARRVTGFGSGLERTLVAPSLTYDLGQDRSLTGAVVLAYQQFATWGLGSTAVQELPPAFVESSFGSGVRLQYEQRFNEYLGFNAAYQSRINMNAFQSYRGVYSEPGDFDLPAFASAGVDWALTPRATVGIGVSRVMYSEISPFTSGALPTRFLSLLGDGVSPTFAWRDLTVYSADVSWRATSRDIFELRYTTQQQPEPTSALLMSALEEDFTDNNLAFAYTRRVGDSGSLRLAASYVPSQYFLGNASYLNRDGKGAQVELEAVWTVHF